MEDGKNSYGQITCVDPDGFVTGDGSTAKKQLDIIDFVQGTFADHRLVSVLGIEDGTVVIGVENPASTGRDNPVPMRLSMETFTGVLMTMLMYLECKGMKMDDLVRNAFERDKMDYTYSDNLTDPFVASARQQHTELYFARYLPVEGKAQEGDYVRIKPHNSDGIPLGGVGTVHKVNKVDDSTGTLYYYAQEALIPAENSFRVELFLCTRQVEPGDMVIDENTMGTPFIWTRMMDSCLSAEPVFKPIARISPRAVWVKEGDKFTRNDILVHEWGGSSVRKPIELARITEESYVLIKGADGKFH